MEEWSGLWDCDGCWFASLRACGRNACIRKSGGGGVEKKIFSLSLRPPPPYLLLHACIQDGCKGVQIAFKGRLAHLWFLRVLIPEKGKRALNRKQKAAKGNSVRRSFHKKAIL